MGGGGGLIKEMLVLIQRKLGGGVIKEMLMLMPRKWGLVKEILVKGPRHHAACLCYLGWRWSQQAG